MLKKFSDEQLPGFLSKFEKLLVANKGGDGFFVGDSVGNFIRYIYLVLTVFKLLNDYTLASSLLFYHTVELQLTWADLAFVSGCGLIAFLGLISQLDNYPKLKAMKTKVEKLPKIAEWIAKRPVTDY